MVDTAPGMWLTRVNLNRKPPHREPEMLDQIREMIDDPDTLPEVAIVLGYLWLSIATGELGEPE